MLRLFTESVMAEAAQLTRHLNPTSPPPSAGKAEVFNTKLTFWVSAVSQIQDFDRSPNITRVLFPTEKPEIIGT